ncbi:hypothetical protein HMPREF9578_01746 [Cutibacterium acnes HL110PA4]|nr:hypothetical protein HMPREF9619_01561 [Cutibacterium acnes HL082PA2]EFT64324.1 hypothetical protein HMPREF9578_01746 [Cutibacterium acnes HL110PA4]
MGSPWIRPNDAVCLKAYKASFAYFWPSWQWVWRISSPGIRCVGTLT